MTSLPVTSPSRDDPRLKRGFPLSTAREECMKKTQGGDSNYSITESSPYPKSSVCRAGEEWFGVNDPCPSVSLAGKQETNFFGGTRRHRRSFFFSVGSVTVTVLWQQIGGRTSLLTIHVRRDHARISVADGWLLLP